MRAVPLPEPNDGRDGAKRLFDWPGGDEQACLADIDAEIADHLAAAAAEFARRGRSSDEAEAISRARFGDVATIRRKCWWIQQGDRIMFRWFGIALFASLIVAVLALAVGGWRVQTALASRLDALTEELTSIHDAQQQLLLRQPSEVAPEIRGRAYFGDVSRPAAGAEIEIWNASEMKLFRRLYADRDGRFRSQPLPPGDYFALASLLPEEGKDALCSVIGFQSIRHLVESQPLYVYAGAELSELAIDLQLQFGQVSFEIAKPQEIEPPAGNADAVFRYRALLILSPDSPTPSLPIDPNGPDQILRMPLRGRSGNGPWMEPRTDDHFGGSAVRPLLNCPRLMAGRYKAALLVQPYFATGDLKWISQELAELCQRDWYGQGYYSAPSIALEQSGYRSFDVAAGKRTHLRFVVPEEIEAIWRDLLTGEHKAGEGEIEAWMQPRSAKVEVVADQPLLSLD